MGDPREGDMATVYIEGFIVQNACVDAALLWLAAAWRGAKIRPWRLLLGTLVGVLFAVGAALLGGVLRTAFAQLLASGAMVALAAAPRSALEGVTLTGVLWLGALLAGGAAALGLSMLPAGVMTGFAGMALLRRKNAPPPPTASVAIRRGDKTIALEAVVDTGNRALDPWTAMPVVFVAAGLFPGEKGRPMAIRTAAGKRALCCFTPDAIAVNGQPVRAAVALAPDDFLDCALVPAGLCAQRRA
jgi:hypothetical protein